MVSEEQLKAKFPDSDILWRVQNSGMGKEKPWCMVLAYVDARAVMDRLDDVFGIDGWTDQYDHLSGGTVCSLSCFFKDLDRWVTKQDGSPETAVEGFKGGISKALVRTAVKFGIGRYLYNLDVTFANTSLERKEGWNKASVKDRSGKYVTYYWERPTLPKEFLPPNPLEERKSIILDKIKELTDNFADKDSLNDIVEYLGIESSKDILDSDDEAFLDEIIKRLGDK